jgi:O-antigen/teichoic acid export membrane protein
MAVRKIASVAVATATHSVLALGLSVVLARVLGPEGRGSYALLTMAAMMGSALGTLGFENAAVYTLGRHPEQARLVVAASLLLAAGSGAVIASLVVWSAAAPASWCPPTARGLVVVASLAIPLLMLALLLNGALIGLGRVADSAWLGTGGVALLLLLVTAATLLSAPPHRLGGIVSAFTMGAALQAAVPLVWLARTAGSPLVDPRPAFSGGLGYSLTSHAATVLHMLHLRADVFLVSFYLGPREVGLYALAQAVCEWVWLLPRSAATVLFPFVAGNDDRRALAATARTCRVVFSIAGLAGLGLALAAPLLVPALFGSAFSGSVGPIRLLLPGIWLGSIAGSLSAFLAGRGRPDLPLLTSLVSLILNVTLNLGLVPRHGIAGASLASAISYSFMAAINVVWCRRMAVFPLSDLLVLHRDDLLSIRQEITARWSQWTNRG